MQGGGYHDFAAVVVVYCSWWGEAVENLPKSRTRYGGWGGGGHKKVS